jgi:hypothetical protein
MSSNRSSAHVCLCKSNGSVGAVGVINTCAVAVCDTNYTCVFVRLVLLCIVQQCDSPLVILMV